MPDYAKPAFLSDHLWRRCLPVIQKPNVMRHGSLDGKWNPCLPFLSQHNALAFQAVVADYVAACLKQGEDVGDKEEIRLQLGIIIGEENVTFALPRILRSLPIADQQLAAALVNRRYQPRRGWPWGPSCVEDVLLRSAEMSGAGEGSETARERSGSETSCEVGVTGDLPRCTNPEAPVDSTAAASLPFPPQSVAFPSTLRSSTPPQVQAEGDRTGYDASVDSATLPHTGEDSSGCDPTLLSTTLPHELDSSCYDADCTPMGRRQRERSLLPDRSNMPLRLPDLLERGFENRIDTPLARRQEGRNWQRPHGVSPLQSPDLPERVPDVEADIDDAPFEMPPEPDLDTVVLDTTEGTEQLPRTPASHLPQRATKIRSCSRCKDRGHRCEAPAAGNQPRTKRPACIKCAASHKTCDMRIVDEADEAEYKELLDVLEVIEEAYDNDMPSDVGSWVWMLEATAKRLQEVQW